MKCTGRDWASCRACANGCLTAGCNHGVVEGAARCAPGVTEGSRWDELPDLQPQGPLGVHGRSAGACTAQRCNSQSVTAADGSTIAAGAPQAGSGQEPGGHQTGGSLRPAAGWGVLRTRAQALLQRRGRHRSSSSTRHQRVKASPAALRWRRRWTSGRADRQRRCRWQAARRQARRRGQAAQVLLRQDPERLPGHQPAEQGGGCGHPVPAAHLCRPQRAGPRPGDAGPPLHLPCLQGAVGRLAVRPAAGAGPAWAALVCAGLQAACMMHNLVCARPAQQPWATLHWLVRSSAAQPCAGREQETAALAGPSS